MGARKTPAEETRERILKATAKLIIEQGYARTSTRAIAAEAGVNEVTLFRHFGSKENLFHEMVEKNSKLSQLTDTMMKPLTGDYRQDMHHIGQIFMKVMMDRSDVIRMILCEAAHFPEVRTVMAQNPRRLRLALAKYLHQQMEVGVVRKQDPELTAQAFYGVFFSYAVLRGVLDEDPASGKTPDQVAQDFVDLFVDGTIALEGKKGGM
jgi:AcrR family transcriptional regulator